MAVMDSTNRASACRNFTDEICTARESFGALTKAQKQAAIDAVDQYLSDNASAFNTAIPQPARAHLSTTQKARLLIHVVRQRYLAGV